MNIDITYLLIVVVVIFVSMTLHEYMHGLVADRLGDTTPRQEGRLTLNPLAHVDPFLTLILPLSLALFGLPIFGGAKPVPFNPTKVRFGEFGAALVSVAGPLTNFLLAFLSFIVYVMSGYPPINNPVGLVLLTSVSVNLGFFVFNMLPIPPLDGSRVLYAIAPDWARRGMEMIEQYGIILVFGLIMIFSAALNKYMDAAITFLFDAFARLFGV